MAKPRRSKKLTEQEQINRQVFGLAINKLLTDYVAARKFYPDGIEKYFEDWMQSNFFTWTVEFENALLRTFVSMIGMCGRQPEKRK